MYNFCYTTAIGLSLYWFRRTCYFNDKTYCVWQLSCQKFKCYLVYYFILAVQLITRRKENNIPGMLYPYIAWLFQFFAQFATQNVGKTSLSLASPEQSFSHLVTSYPGVPGSHTSSRTSVRTEQDSQGFSASLLYKGYLDDPRNTDNAWMEAEVWNFHYDIGDNFELRMSEVILYNKSNQKLNQKM